MARTQYDPHRAEFSNRAHATARALIYPELFATIPESLNFEDDTLLTEGKRGGLLDGEMGIDRIVHVTVPNLHGTLRFTVQERFRLPEYACWQDLTITEWNGTSNTPSELYKITAGYFLYGYYDETNRSFPEALVICMPELLRRLAMREIPFRRQLNKKGQTFFGFTFADLDAAGVICLHHYDQKIDGNISEKVVDSLPGLMV